MAANILLYQADLVPVDQDQKQHLELRRDLVGYFDNRYGAGALKVLEPYIPEVGAKIMSLTDPESKMSKSSANEKRYISIIDQPQKITKKIKSAVTDSDTLVDYDSRKKPDSQTS
jgi:tryptophanyl-tRNA synthetase